MSQLMNHAKYVATCTSPVQLPTIKIHDDPEFQGEDNGPSKHQFDTLHENEEIVSLSGFMSGSLSWK